MVWLWRSDTISFSITYSQIADMNLTLCNIMAVATFLTVQFVCGRLVILRTSELAYSEFCLFVYLWHLFINCVKLYSTLTIGRPAIHAVWGVSYFAARMVQYCGLYFAACMVQYCHMGQLQPPFSVFLCVHWLCLLQHYLSFECWLLLIILCMFVDLWMSLMKQSLRQRQILV